MGIMEVRRFGLILAIQAEIEGMKSENKMRKGNAESPAYLEESFYVKADEIRNLVYCPEEKL